MKASLHCIPCFIRQTLDTAGDLGLTDSVTTELVNDTLAFLQQVDLSLPPPVIARDIHRRIRFVTGIDDPYEIPPRAEIVLDSDNKDVETLAGEVVTFLQHNEIIA